MLKFPILFTVCAIGIEAIVVDEKHWRKFGSAENREEWATAHFLVYVAKEIFGSMLLSFVSRQRWSQQSWSRRVMKENLAMHDRDRGHGESALGVRTTRRCSRDRRP